MLEHHLPHIRNMTFVNPGLFFFLQGLLPPLKCFSVMFYDWVNINMNLLILYTKTFSLA